jgi:hypothetical protein
VTRSPAIEGVIVADADRAHRIIDRRTTTLRNRSEQERSATWTRLPITALT